MSNPLKFGTFGGVFTPSILTILGVIMYLRLPMIVGEAGLISTIGIILVAHIISATTGISVSSIATDKKVQAGGTYYMISRSLGLPIGGTLGIALFIGLSFSVSLYLIGFAESFLSFWGYEITKDSIRIAGTITLIAVTTITFISTSLAIRTQYIIMAAIGLSLISILVGRHEFAPAQTLIENPPGTLPLMVLFGIFFPAVTGFEAGVSMSGDLRDPKKSIPVGSLSAITVGFVVYIALAWFLAATVDGKMLAGDSNVLLKIALVPELVIAGVWGATLSSSLGSILGAPRILQATALDKITPRFFARGSGVTNEPRNALLLTFVIAEAGILIGELDIIARIVSIFFIITYGFLNLSCAFETWTSADFRPDFKAPIWVSLLGTAACAIVMIQLDLLAMIGGTVLLGGLFLLLKRKELRLESGDAWDGVWASLVKSGIDYLSKAGMHTRNWRPNIILFRGPKDRRSHLYELGRAITGRLGVLSSFEVQETQNAHEQRIEQVPSDEPGVHTFRYPGTDVYEGMKDIIRLYGFAGVQPNTVLMGWSKKERLQEEYVAAIRSAIQTDMNVILLKYDTNRGFGTATTIDMWWGGRGANLAFAITLLRHISTSTMWRTARTRLMLINSTGERSEKITRRLHRILQDYRISMEVHVINNHGDVLSPIEIIRRESGATDLTLLGFPNASSPDLMEKLQETDSLLEHLGSAVVIHGSSQFEELDAGLERPRHDVEEVAGEEIVLPPLPASSSPFVQADMHKISDNGERQLTRFYEQAIALWVSEERKLIAEFKGICETVFEELEEMLRYKDSFRRKKALLRIQNDYFYRCRQLVGSLKDETVAHQTEQLEEGVKWFTRKLEQDIVRFPKLLRLEFPAGQLRIHKEDGVVESAIKVWKRMLHRLTGRPPARHVPYRELARHYLFETRHLFLKAYLEKFQSDTAGSLSQLRSTMLDLSEHLSSLEQNLGTKALTKEDVASASKKYTAAVSNLNQAAVRKGELYRHRLLLEFNKNLTAMAGELERFDAARRLRHRTIPVKRLRQAVAANANFPESWAQAIELVVDKVMLDIAIGSLRSRVHDRMNELETHVVQQINSHLTSPMVKLGKTLEDKAGTNDQVKIEFEFEKSFELLDDLDEAHEDILEITRSLPERLLIMDTPDETAPVEPVEVPAIRLAQHYIESELISHVQKSLTDVTERLIKIGYSVKDHVNFARFEVENIDADVADKDGARQRIFKETLDNLNGELEEVATLKREFSELMRERIGRTFDALAPHMVVRSALQFNDVLRDYKTGKVISTFGRLRDRAEEFVQKQIARLVYSRREGVLLAQKLSAKPQGLDSSRILDLLDELSPDPDVLKDLPQFYINLFSGRSSIGAEFWIRREKEEEEFATALRRHRAGVHGGILILAERNAGKTAFARYNGARHFKKSSVYHLFPPREGSVDPGVLARTLGKATGLTGSAEDIIGSLSRDSTLFVHDLELWFERRDGGGAVLNTICKMIEQHGQDILFVVNTTVPAYELMRSIEPLDHLIADTITLAPMSTQQLQQMVMLRHQASGMQFMLGKKDESSLSDFARARLFDRYFRVAQGNPGVTLTSWLVNITQVRADILDIRLPEHPQTGVLYELPDDWLIYLTQFVLHKRLNAEKLARITGADAQAMERVVRHLFAAGLLEQRSPGLYMINGYIDHLVRRVLRERQLL